MMKKQRIFTLIIVGMVTLLLTAGPVLAQAVRTKFEGTRIRTIGMIEPGTSWDSDGVRHMRDRMGVWGIETNDDDRVSGQKYFVINFNSQLPDKTGRCFIMGPMWGTFILVPDIYCTGRDDKDLCIEWTGSWEGTYTGNWDGYGYAYQDYVGHGTGELEGLQIRAFTEVLYPSCETSPPNNIWSFEGYILDPHGE
jgi:hypothetical protein